MSAAVLTLVACIVIKKLAQVIYKDCKPAIWIAFIAAVIMGGAIVITILEKILLIPVLWLL